MKKILFIIIAVLISVTLNAQKWYVATTGSDTNGDGSVTYPWKTVKHAADTITGANFVGDTIYVLAGTYNEASRCNLAVGVSIVGVDSSTTILNMTYTATGVTDACIYLNSAVANPVDGNQYISNLTINGSLDHASRAIVINYRNNVKIHHCTTKDFRDCGIQFRAHNTGGNDEPTVLRAVNNAVYNCTIDNCTSYQSASDGNIRLEGQKDFLFYNNYVRQIGKAATDNAANFSGYQFEGIKFYDNIFIKDDTNGGFWNFHFEIHNQRGGNEYYDNEFIGHANVDFAGSERRAYSFSIKFHNNTMYANNNIERVGNISPAITFERDNQDCYIYQNHFKNYQNGMSIANAYNTTERIYVYYNIIENAKNLTDNYSFGIYIESDESNTALPLPFSDIYIFNNVITTNIGEFGAYEGIGVYVNGTITNLQIINNIIRGFGSFISGGIRFHNIEGGTKTLTNLKTLNNIIYGTASNYYRFDGTLILINHETDTALVTDPLFVGTGTPPLNYKLQSGSPAKDAGISVGLTSDYGGYNVPVGPLPDIGAWEYGADVTPPNWHPTGLGWDDNYFKNNFRDAVNFTVPPTIAGAPLNLAALLPSGLTATINDLNATAGATGNFQGQLNTKAALSTPSFTTSITIAGDTTVTAVIGKIVYQAADSSFYGCRSTVAPKKWYKLND